MIVGNVALYGATSGEAYFRGRAGERFAVRNSGAKAVVEGVGDHACEYMTGGVVVVLGPTGRNFAAGMSGGLAFVYDPGRARSASRCNPEMVDLVPVEEYKDVGVLSNLLNRHVLYTGSTVARRHRQRLRTRAGQVREGVPEGLPAGARTEPGRPAAVGTGQRLTSGPLRRRGIPFGNGDIMSDPRGFLSVDPQKPMPRPVHQRIKDYAELYQPMPAEGVRAQATRCMDCGIPFCHTGCPLGNLIPDWNDLVHRNRWEEALVALHDTNNFPEFTGKTCPAPCESACVLAAERHGRHDQDDRGRDRR